MKTPGPKQKIKVLIAEDHESIRTALRVTLRLMAFFDIVGEAADGIEALRLCEELHPDVLLLDLGMPKMDGLAVMHEIRRRKLKIPTVFYTGQDSDSELRNALALRPDGFMHKLDTFEQLGMALRCALTEQPFYSSSIEEAQRRTVATVSPLSQLTKSEIEVMEHIARGKETKEISQILHKSESTVKNQRNSMMHKLGVHNVAGITAIAFREKLVRLKDICLSGDR